MQELTTSSWFEGSTKIVSKNVDHALIIPTLGAFLRAGEVEGNTQSAGTLAAKSKSGSLLRVLVKVSNGDDGKSFMAKLDVKCTDEKLCECIVSDLKKLQL